MGSGGAPCSLYDSALRFYVIEGWKEFEVPVDRPDYPRAVPIRRRVQFTFEGASPAVKVAGLEKRQAIASYFLGNDPSRWASAVPTFGAVQYTGLYPGIDMRVFQAEGGLEYDLELQPGADPSQVRLRIDGAAKSELTAEGALRITTAGGAQLMQYPPQSFELGMDGQRRPLESRFVEAAEHVFRLELGGWDGMTNVVVDPVVAMPTVFSYLGGGQTEFGFDVALFLGKPTVTGCTLTHPQDQQVSEFFPITSGAFLSTFADAFCGYVSQFSGNSGDLLWSTFYGSSQIQNALSADTPVVAPHGIAIDGTGNVYIAGFTGSADLPITAGVVQPNALGLGDGFVAKLNPNGTALTYSTYITASFQDVVEDIAVSPSGNAFITGYSSTNAATPLPSGGSLVPPGQAVVEPLPGFAAPWVGFVARLPIAGGPTFDYLTFVGSAGGTTTPKAIALDFDDAEPTRINAVVVGGSTGGIQTPGGFQTSPPTEEDAFVSILNHTATAWTFGTFLGGTQSGPLVAAIDRAFGVSVSPSHIVGVTGFTQAVDFPLTSNAAQGALAGGSDAFVVRINPNATIKLVYSTYYGGTGEEHGNDVTIDSAGALYVTGWTTSLTGLPIVDPIMTQPTSSGGRDGFVLKIRNAAFQLSSYFGGNGADAGAGIALEPGAFFVTGTTLSPDFPANLGAIFGFDLTINNSGTASDLGSPPFPFTPFWNLDNFLDLGNFLAGSDAYIAKCELQ